MTAHTSSSTNTTDANDTILDRTKASVSHAAEVTRETAGNAYDSTRDTARTAARKTADGVEHNPLSALVGGLAVGVAIGALLPKTQAEAKHLGPVGRRITEGATAAARAAREQGRQEIEALIPDKGAAKERVSSLVGSVAQAARDGAKRA